MESIKRWVAKTEVPPLLTIRQIVWVLLAGWLVNAKPYS